MDSAPPVVADRPTLERALGPFDLVAIGVGSAIGSGIFVMTGTVAAQYAGPAIALSFLLASVACLLTGLCYAELAAMLPKAGSAYSYTLAAFGKRFAWAVGWCLVLEYLVAASTVAVGWSGYATGAAARLGLELPQSLIAAPLMVNAGELVPSGALINLPAALIVLAMTALLVLGVRESALANNVLVIVKVGVILLVILVGAHYVQPANWTPFIPENTGSTGSYGASGVLRAAGIIFYAYIGFETISTCAQETRRPQRDLGIAILVALAICTALYVGLALVMTGLVHYSRLNVADPIMVSLDAGGTALDWVKPLVSVGAIVGLGSTILVTLYGQTRIFYTMSQDHALPAAFSRLHPRFRTPATGVVISGIACAAIAAMFPLEVLGELVSIGTLLAFAAVCVAVLVLRAREPQLPRPFRVPLGPTIPLLGTLLCLYFAVSLPAASWWRLAVWLALGASLYASLVRRRRGAN